MPFLGVRRCGVSAVHTVIVYEVGLEMVPRAMLSLWRLAWRAWLDFTSMKKVQCVFVVIHEVDTLAGHRRESKQSASSGRVAHVV